MYKKAILDGMSQSHSCSLISRKVYLSYPTAIFKGREDLEFEILNSIAQELKIPFTCIKTTGSAKTGFSLINRSEFEKGKSDLDIAIINNELFMRFFEDTYRITKGYSDLSNFHDSNAYKTYLKYLSKGIIHPFYLPRGGLKELFQEFFKTILSNKYSDCFTEITACVYASEFFFEMKQVKAIEDYYPIMEV